MTIFKKEINKKSLVNTIIMAVLLLFVSVMLSSFIFRVAVSPKVESTVIIEKSQEKIQKPIQLSILNACGVPGIAKKMKEYLRSRGFDVVEIGNYTSVSEKSFVLDRMRDSVSASKVAEAIGLNKNFVKTAVDSTLYVRCSIVLGKDFQELRAYK
jgi:hypothetical protein